MLVLVVYAGECVGFMVCFWGVVMPKRDSEKEHGNWISANGDKDDNPSPWSVIHWTGLGVEIAGLVALFSYAGWWADGKLGHAFPILTLTGFVVAFVGRMYLLYKEVKSQE